MVVCAQLHFNVWQEMGIKYDKGHWYENVLITVETSHQIKATVLWTQQARVTELANGTISESS
jgi:hypothetical protein